MPVSGRLLSLLPLDVLRMQETGPVGDPQPDYLQEGGAGGLVHRVRDEPYEGRSEGFAGLAGVMGGGEAEDG